MKLVELFWAGVWVWISQLKDLDTPGTALDGWSREELAASMAWSSGGDKAMTAIVND